MHIVIHGICGGIVVLREDTLESHIAINASRVHLSLLSRAWKKQVTKCARKNSRGKGCPLFFKL
jgi:hypothetical protein